MTTPVKERTFESDEKLKLPRPFILRRLHSLLGVWLVIYLFEHLLVNSQAALFFKDEGFGFVAMVNKIHDLPYLKAVEILFLGLPFLMHGVWGIIYALSGKLNAHRTKGAKPALPQYKRNRAYSWQRITSWLLVIGILAHVVHMRFLEYPVHFQHGDQKFYMTRLEYDAGLPLTVEKLHARLFNDEQIKKKNEAVRKEEAKLVELDKEHAGETGYIPNDTYYRLQNRLAEEKEWVESAEKLPLQKRGQVLAVTHSAGAAFFLIVRETFKNPLMVILYSLLVIASCYHAFNGLWTFMISWGVTLTRRSQKRMRAMTTILMGLVMFFGLLASWGTYLTTIMQQ